MRRNLPLILLALGVILVAGASFYYWLDSLPDPVPSGSMGVPQTLAGLELARHESGDAAISAINQLHGLDFPLAGGDVAIYGDQNISLWVSIAQSTSSAANLITRMEARIGEGNSPFTSTGVYTFSNREVYALEGLDQLHFYFQAGDKVIWVSADAELAERALVEVLGYYK